VVLALLLLLLLLPRLLLKAHDLTRVCIRHVAGSKERWSGSSHALEERRDQARSTGEEGGEVLVGVALNKEDVD
jgi:hypothetical protein